MTPGPTPAGPSVRARPPHRGRRNRVVAVVGILLLVLGLGCLGYVGYEVFGSNVGSRRAYQRERDQLRQQWQQTPRTRQPAKGHPTPDPAVPGDAIALISIPAIGLSDVPVLEGTSADVLARGIGHYRQTAGPGQTGNFAVAGHRITHGEPFAKLLELRKGDRVIVETRSTVYTYAVDTVPEKLTVTDTEGWVLDPVPGHPGAKPTEPMITLTTCQDLFHSPDRSVGFGHLVHSRRKR